MKIKNFCKTHENLLISLFAIVIFGGFICLRYDLIYELNDDTVIRNLLSGTYTGTPTAMNNQMMFILSAAISCLYKIIPSVQWFDIFLIICQYICVCSVLYVLVSNTKKYAYKFMVIIAVLLFLTTFMLNHFVFITYTVTSGMLAVASIFLFVTDKNKISGQSMIAVFMSVLSFCLRSEMLLMLLPFICLAGVYCWSTESVIFTLDNVKKYFGLFGVLLGCIAFVFFTDQMVYSSEEWQEFRSFFNARTSIYDYTDIPLYNNNEEFYQQNDISYEQYLLFRSYNFALDEEIDSDMINIIAEYAKNTGVDLKEKINIALGAYRIQITDKIGTLYHTLALLGYVILLCSINTNNKWRIFISAGILFFTRSIVWMYLWGQGRVVDRITHPLYWAEFILLLAVFIEENRNNKNKGALKKKCFIFCCTIVISLIMLMPQISLLNEKYNVLISKAEYNLKIHQYCNDNDSSFYMIPIYPVSILPEKIFNDYNIPSNTELLGGWYAKSPLYYKKLVNNGVIKIDDAILYGDVFLIQDRDYVSYDTTYPFEWLTGYYASKGIDVEVTETDTIVDNIGVYKVEIKE